MSEYSGVAATNNHKDQLENMVINFQWVRPVILVALAVLIVACSNNGGSSSGSGLVDEDRDGIADIHDNCPDVANTDQSDGNEDGTGDACEDGDNDSVYDALDNCPLMANEDQVDGNGDGVGDACEVFYSFVDANGQSTVAYEEQTAVNIIVSDVQRFVAGLERGGLSESDILEQLMRYYTNIAEVGQPVGSALDDNDIVLSLNGELTLLTNSLNASDTTFASLANGMNLQDRIAGNDLCSHILVEGDKAQVCEGGSRGEFFGWQTGLNTDSFVRTPEDLLFNMFGLLALEASESNVPWTIDTVAESAVEVTAPHVNVYGQDIASSIESFLLGAVVFSQVTADHLASLHSSHAEESVLQLREGSNATVGQSSLDAAFGYFGAARHTALYSTLEISGDASDNDGARSNFRYGYFDQNDDGSIDVRSEYMFHSIKLCAGSDYGSRLNGALATDLTGELMRSFLSARELLQIVGDAGEISAEQQDSLDEFIEQIAENWEKCLAASAIQSLNELAAEILRYDNGSFADETNFLAVAKAWSNMKFLTMSLQYSPFSPFRSSRHSVDIDDLKLALDKMAEAPILPNGTVMGEVYPAIGLGGSPESNIQGYLFALQEARLILQVAYDFSHINVVSW